MKSGLASGVLLLTLAAALLGAGIVGERGGIAAPVTDAGGQPSLREPREPREPPTADRGSRRPEPDRGRVPSAAALRDARRFAESREGLVSFAAVNIDGQRRGYLEERSFDSASVVKAMLLAAELDRIGDAPLDDQTQSLLRSMITVSDNDAADAIYARVGDAGLTGVAERAGMTAFSVAGHWGNAQVTAADMARCFGDLELVIRGPHREFGLGLLGSIAEEQSWGIPKAAGEDWAVRFKGGWLPDRALVHQAAELRERHGPRVVSIAVLTDSQPSFSYGLATVAGVAERLLHR